jgi:hypothetical protein
LEENAMARRLSFSIALLAAIALLSPSWTHAYEMSGVGFKLGYVSPEDLDGTVNVSGHLEFEESGSRVHLLPNVAYWNSDFVSDVNPNFDLYYHFEREGSVTPYIGGGVGIHVLSFDVPEGFDDSETDFGVNAMLGVRFPSTNNHIFVEGRAAITDVSQLAILGGITFHTR